VIRYPEELREIALGKRNSIQLINGDPHICVATTNQMDVWRRALAERGGLAVHQGLTRRQSGCACPEVEGYHVSHVASGFAILCMPTLQRAVAAMDALAPLTDWTVTGEQIHRMPDAQHAAVKAAIAAIEGRPEEAVHP
jgi:hypothetical protein